MFNKYLLLFPTLLFVPLSSQASSDSFYVGARFGGTHYSDFKQNGYDVSGVDQKKNNVGAGVFAGLNITPYLALESGYTWLGEFKYGSEKIDQNAIDFTGKMTFHFNDQWGVFAKAGGSYFLSDYNGNGIEDVDDQLIGTGGVGVEYQLNDHLSTRFEYQYYHQSKCEPCTSGNISKLNTHFYGLSLVYTWGEKTASKLDLGSSIKAKLIAPPDITLLYGINKAQLTDNNKRYIEPMVKYLMKSPSARVQITGYASSTGTAAYNQKLSERRAANVAKFLAQHNVDPKQVTTKGMGESHPVADNSTLEGRAKNRRVEITSP